MNPNVKNLVLLNIVAELEYQEGNGLPEKWAEANNLPEHAVVRAYKEIVAGLKRRIRQ